MLLNNITNDTITENNEFYELPRILASNMNLNLKTKVGQKFVEFMHDIFGV